MAPCLLLLTAIQWLKRVFLLLEAAVLSVSTLWKLCLKNKYGPPYKSWVLTQHAINLLVRSTMLKIWSPPHRYGRSLTRFSPARSKHCLSYRHWENGEVAVLVQDQRWRDQKWPWLRSRQHLRQSIRIYFFRVSHWQIVIRLSWWDCADGYDCI